jgi:hypothetical protein
MLHPAGVRCATLHQDLYVFAARVIFFKAAVQLTTSAMGCNAVSISIFIRKRWIC